MSVFPWSRRPSDSSSIPPRPRTTSGGGLAALAGSMLSLSKAKSRERLRTKPSPNRQTVISTESESSVWPNEPTTPSDTKQSFQGVGMVGDDPFARPPVYVSKDKPESPVPSLAAFPVPPPRRNDPGPSRHLHPPSPKSSSSKLSPSSRASSRSRSTSASSTPPLVSSVSPADMHAHADAFSWTESIYDDRPDDDKPGVRRGQSAHAVTSSLPPPRLTHSASASHLSASTLSRAGSSAVSGMASMTAMASGIVKRLEEGERRRPPKRPSRSELRDPPTRKSSLLGLQSSSTNGRLTELEPTLESIPTRSPRALDPTRSPDSIFKALEPRSPDLRRTLESLELTDASPRPRTASSPSRPQTTSPRLGLARPAASPRLGSTRPRNPTSPRLLHSPASPHLFSSPCAPSSPASPLWPTSPTRLAVPPTDLDQDSEDLDDYHFTIAPTIRETDAQSISFSELGFHLEEDVWSDDGVTFHHGPTDSLHHISADSRRPPPSPTSLPFMAGNARRRLGQDMVYPSGVHTIPVADRRALARLGDEGWRVGREEDAVVGRSVEVEGAGRLGGAGKLDEATLDDTAVIEEPSSPNPLKRISSMSGSHTSSGSSITPDAVPPQTVSSHIAFSKHTRTASYSDSELDFELSSRSKPARHVQSTQTAVAWRCGAGNHEKCCGTRAIEGTAGQYKCCADRTPNGKHARCCASYIGRPCERPRARVSSTSSTELKRQRSLHFASGGKRAKGFFHRPHTSHCKSTSEALLDDETRAMIQSTKTREDPGPQSPTSDLFATPASAPAPSTVTSPPTSPASRHEFKAKPIISPAKLHNHLKETRPDPLKSPTLEPTRARSNTDASGSTSRSMFSNGSEDAPAPMRSLLPPRPRRNQNVSLPTMTACQPVEQPRRYVQSITGVMQPVGLTRPPALSSGSSFASSSFSSLASGSLSSLASGSFSSLSSGPLSSLSSGGFAPLPLRSGLPPPPRRDHVGRTHTQPIVSFISSHSAPTTALRHHSSRESYESSRTIRRERSIPLRETQMSFLEFGVEEEEESESEEEERGRPALHQSQSFLDLSRLSGDSMREADAMFSRP